MTKKHPLFSRWFDAYAAGNPDPFPWEWICFNTGTLFERRVWEVLWKIPFGKTVSYAWVAKKCGIPKGGAQAVGQANKKNPL
ncbi:MAG: MGMT family protein, partial [Deltaproteobacteria bacterium]|nr:MGMT family protein [Deltaproteobacteria bacterium]